MRFRRQLLKPGRRIAQIGKLSLHPFFTRRREDEPQARADAASHATRGALPALAENTGAVFSILVSVVLIGLIVALLIAFAVELRRDTVVVVPIGVPQDVAARGYSSVAASQLVVNEIVNIQRLANTSHALRPLVSGSDIPDVHIIGANTSMQSLVRYARSAFGHREPTIDGLILRDPTGLRMVINLQDRTSVHRLTVTRGDDNVEALLEDGARATVQLADPYILASYLFQTEARESGYPKTLAAIAYVLDNPPGDDDAWALNLWGLLLERQGDLAAAEVKYRAALTLPGIPETKVLGNLARVMVANGRRDAARSLLERAAGAPDAGFDALALACEELYFMPDVATTAGYCTRAIALRPDVPTTYVWRALFAADRGRHGAAWRDIETARTSSDAQEWSWASAWVYVETLRGHGADAIKRSDALLSQMPADEANRAWLHLTRSIALRLAGRVNDALAEMALFDRDASTPPARRYFAAWNRGEIALLQHAPAEALRLFDSALATGPGYPPALAGRAAALAALGRNADADAAFVQATKAAPDRAETWKAWSDALAARGDAAGAAARLGEARQAGVRASADTASR